MSQSRCIFQTISFVNRFQVFCFAHIGNGHTQYGITLTPFFLPLLLTRSGCHQFIFSISDSVTFSYSSSSFLFLLLSLITAMFAARNPPIHHVVCAISTAETSFVQTEINIHAYIHKLLSCCFIFYKLTLRIFCVRAYREISTHASEGLFVRNLTKSRRCKNKYPSDIPIVNCYSKSSINWIELLERNEKKTGEKCKLPIVWSEQKYRRMRSFLRHVF